MTLRTMQPKRMAKLTNITSKTDEMEVNAIGVIIVLSIFSIGMFTALVILRPDLIDWRAFERSFMLGIIMGMR